MVGDDGRDETDRTRVRDSPHAPQETPSPPSPETATYCYAIHRRLELLESAGFWVDSGLSLPARADYDARTVFERDIFRARARVQPPYYAHKFFLMVRRKNVIRFLIITMNQLRATADVGGGIGWSSEMDCLKALDLYFPELHWSSFLDFVRKYRYRNKNDASFFPECFRTENPSAPGNELKPAWSPL